MATYSRRQFFALTGGGLIAAYAAAACGDDGDNDGGATPAENANTPATTPAVSAGVDRGALAIRWFGQSMFVITSPEGTRVLLDPFNDIGYPVPPPLDVDAATITHEHPDHNNASLAGVAATVHRGLTADGWNDIDATAGDVRIRSVRSFHDGAQGAERGRNAIFVLEVAGMRVVHLGDLGHELDDARVSAIGGPTDALMVPVGGMFTIDAGVATRVAGRLGARVVFPMHYKTDAIAFPLAPVDPFLEGKEVQRVGSTDIRISKDDLPGTQTVMVLDYA